MARIKEQTKTTSIKPDDSFILDRNEPDETFRIEAADLKNQLLTIEVNDIGKPGEIGFGVGICPEELLPAYLIPMTGTYDKMSENYGNYVNVIDGSVAVYIPAHAFKVTHDPAPPYFGNKVDCESLKNYGYSEEAANQAGYWVPRSCKNGGQIKKGYFCDKYIWSLTNFQAGVSGIASSVKYGNPITSSVESLRDAVNNYTGSFSNCISNGQSPSNNYAGAIAAAKSRGNDYFPKTIFIDADLALLSQAHAQAAASTSACAWYDPAGIKNYPKGNNNYGVDYDDPSVTYQACDDGYWFSRNEARKTGSASNFPKTTHNGQLCGVADLNGNLWEICIGITCQAVSKTITAITRANPAVITSTGHGFITGDIVMIDGSATTEWNSILQYRFFDVEVIDADTYKLKYRTTDSNNGLYVDATALTADYVSGLSAVKGTFYVLTESVNIANVTSKEHWFNASFFDAIDISDILVNHYVSDAFGNNTNPVLDTSGLLTDLKLPLNMYSLSSQGTNMFGKDRFYKFIRNNMCALSGGDWVSASSAGVWCLHLHNTSTTSSRTVGARSCLYV
ncbi:hypothetical protein ACSSWA_01275 [Melioribacter sp. Ez-97]|uniref:hypothetical protein n=1 Tax=Melioribacter sp. Ez-97 TaxID=3423434 RepID=UPI003ED8D065